MSLECPCLLNPPESKCGEWEDNQSACSCADDVLHLPS